jgi:hypothetical protein
MAATKTKLAFRFVSTLALLLAADPAFAQNQSGEQPKTARTVSISDTSIQGQTFTTDANTFLTVLLPNNSLLSIGPGSSVTIESFTFNPDLGSSSLTGSVGSGSLRITSGDAANQAISLRTPTSTLSLTNGAALIQVSPQGATSTTLLSGSGVTVTNAGGTQTLSRAGFNVVVTAVDQAPGTPQRLEASVLSAQLTTAVAPRGTTTASTPVALAPAPASGPGIGAVTGGAQERRRQALRQRGRDRRRTR